MWFSIGFSVTNIYSVGLGFYISFVGVLLIQQPDFALLRQLLVIGINQKIAIQWDFPITYEMARAYQKANGKYLRQNQWEDITLVMSLELGK